VTEVLKLSRLDARRFHRRALLLDTPAHGIGEAIAHHGYVQIDPINVCGRMHDLILRNRVAGYREGDLFKRLHGASKVPQPNAERKEFEHHVPETNVLAAMTVDAWPHLLGTMRRRQAVAGSWSGKLDARQRRLAEAILSQMASQGPICSDDIDDQQRARQGWGARATLAKTTLHKLFFHGRVLIARRVNNRRYYDLPERILPASILSEPEPSAAETDRWNVLLKLRQRRLLTLTRQELGLVTDLVQQVEVEGCPPLYCLPADIPLLDTVAEHSHSEIRFLAPLDPLIYDRRLTQKLWGYDYSWEVYTPAAKRVRGYYALPVLAGLELVGHVDPKADRKSKKLVVVKRSLRRGHRIAPALHGLAGFLGLK